MVYSHVKLEPAEDGGHVRALVRHTRLTLDRVLTIGLALWTCSCNDGKTGCVLYDHSERGWEHVE